MKQKLSHMERGMYFPYINGKYIVPWEGRTENDNQRIRKNISNSSRIACDDKDLAQK
jgi:hypothetical protein